MVLIKQNSTVYALGILLVKLFRIRVKRQKTKAKKSRRTDSVGFQDQIDVRWPNKSLSKLPLLQKYELTITTKVKIKLCYSLLYVKNNSLLVVLHSMTSQKC